jgi:glyoxylase-like metal-dependent hydrolase (beta-lactamase superfamily II)
VTDETVIQRTGVAAEPGHGIGIQVGIFGPWQTNAYLVWDGSSTDALVLDPGMGAADVLVARATEIGLRIHVVANSHGHIDHIFDNAAITRASGAPLAIHPDDAYRLAGDNIYGFQVAPSSADQDLLDGETLAIGQLRFRILHTPGHSEGSVCLYESGRGILLSGDVLFRASYGRTDLSGGDDDQMVASLTRLHHEIPPGTRVLPGHGPETTMAREAAWLDRVASGGRLIIPG